MLQKRTTLMSFQYESQFTVGAIYYKWSKHIHRKTRNAQIICNHIFADETALKFIFVLKLSVFLDLCEALYMSRNHLLLLLLCVIVLSLPSQHPRRYESNNEIGNPPGFCPSIVLQAKRLIWELAGGVRCRHNRCHFCRWLFLTHVNKWLLFLCVGAWSLGYSGFLRIYLKNIMLPTFATPTTSTASVAFKKVTNLIGFVFLWLDKTLISGVYTYLKRIGTF